MTRKIGVVTVTYNSADVIDAFMESTLSQSHREFELFIIDNASKDQTLARLDRCADPRIHLIANDRNLGVAEGNNQGILLSRKFNCDYVLLINNDTEFGADLFEAMMAGIEEVGADMVVPKMMFFDPKNVIWCAGGYFKRWLGYVTGHTGQGQPDQGQFDNARRIQYAPTCCMLIKPSVFDRIGLMDARYFVYFDDTDFCWRALKGGIRLWYHPGTTLYHKVSSLTGGNESDFTFQYGTRNKVYFVLKNLGPLSIAYCLVLYHFVFLFRLLRGQDSGRVYKLKLKAYVDGMKLYHSRAS